MSVVLQCQICKGACQRSDLTGTWVHTDEELVLMKSGGVRLEGTWDHEAQPDVVDLI